MALKRIKKVIASALAVAMVATTLVMPVSAEEGFTDVEDGTWYSDSVDRWADADIVTGYEDASGNPTGLFGPADEIQRGQMAVILMRLLGLKAPANKVDFTDVDENAYYYDAVNACEEAKIITGYKDVEGNLLYLFGPEDPITREQAFTMIHRAFKLVAGETEETLGDFSDGAAVSDWAAEATAAMINYNGVSGKEDTPGVFTISPQDNVSRAQITTMLDRLIAVYVDAEGAVSTTTVDATKEEIGTVVVVNGTQEDFVEVSFSVDTEKNVVIDVVKHNEDGTKEEVSVTVPAIQATTQAPVAVEGEKSVKLEEDKIVEINPKDHVCEFVIDATPACTNCASDRVQVLECECGEWIEGEVIKAHPHTFDATKCTECGMLKSIAEKVYFGITANNSGAEGTTTVDATVYNDYSVVANLPMNNISAASVKLDVRMQNVSSMGISSMRQHSQTFSTGMNSIDGDLAYWMSNAPLFTKATVNIDVNGLACAYNVVGNQDPANVVVTATPADVNAVRAAWHEFAGVITTASNPSEDSYVLIDEASYINVGAEKLVFEDGADAMLLDNFSNIDGLKQEIRDSIKLVAGDGTTLALKVGAGTELAVSGSKATLDKDTTITVEVFDANGAPVQISNTALSEIQAASDSNSELVKELFGLLNDVVGTINGATVNVKVAF